MGNLHEVHVSLFTNSQQNNQYTVSSLFINPTQFNKPDDFTHYPRTLEHDLKILTNSRVDFCLLPNEKEMYADNYSYQIRENQLCDLMEGKRRPGHFNGVLTVVMKLLNLTQPTTAYFGEKDYQQFLLIRGMVEALFMNVSIQSCPTIREQSGLAYSSRNNRLAPEQKKRAENFANIFHQRKPCAMIIKELDIAGIKIDYVEEHQNRRFAAVFIDDIRLIDNYLII